MCWPDGKQIEAVDSICLLGIPIDNDLKMSSMVEEKVSNGFKSLWFIKRLQSQGVKQKHLVPVYRAYVQSKIEYGLAPFAKMLTAGQIEHLESPLKRASKLMMKIPIYMPNNDPDYISYADRLKYLGLETIESRILKRHTNLASAIEFDPRFEKFIMLNKSRVTRGRREYVLPVPRTVWSANWFRELVLADSQSQ